MRRLWDRLKAWLKRTLNLGDPFEDAPDYEEW